MSMTSTTIRNKGDLVVAVANLLEEDPRYKEVVAAMAGRREPDRPSSFRLFRISDVARETGLSRVTIWRALKEGRLKSVSIRKGSHRIAESELRRFIQGGN